MASCSTGLPAAANCQEYRLCARPGYVGTVDKQKIDADLATDSTILDSAKIGADEKTVPPPYLTLAEATNEACRDPQLGDVDQAQESSKPTSEGSSWGISLEPTSSFKVNTNKRSDGIGTFGLDASVGAVLKGTAMGYAFDVLSGDLDAHAHDCGVTLTAAVKLFGEAVVVWTPSAAKSWNLVPKAGGKIQTDEGRTQQCVDRKTAMKTEAGALRKTAILARAVKEYYDRNGLTSELCNQIRLDNVSGLGGLDAADCSDPGALPLATKIDIVNAWKNEYDAHSAKYVDAGKQWGTAQRDIATSATATLFDFAQPYEVTIVDVSIPIGPISVNIAAGGYGSWNLKGGIPYGIGVDGSYSDLLEDAANNTLPNSGDIRAHLGVSVTPGAVVGVWAYGGVGIPGVSVGIQGDVDLLAVEIPTGVSLAVMRVKGADARDPNGTAWEGEPVAGLSPNTYRWVTGWQFGSKLNIDALRGHLDLAVRVSILFFKKTFRTTLFGWDGLHWDYLLVGTGGSDALAYSDDTGTDADNIAYTQVPPTAGPILARGESGVEAPGCQPDIR